jgi:hypothetical protein
MGRTVPGPGEPLFLPEDTGAVVALAEEERDTCPACGYPKAVCRAGTLEDLGRLELHEETCWVTYRKALRQDVLTKEASSATQQARQLSVRLKKDRLADYAAGLDVEV